MEAGGLSVAAKTNELPTVLATDTPTDGAGALPKADIVFEYVWPAMYVSDVLTGGANAGPAYMLTGDANSTGRLMVAGLNTGGAADADVDGDSTRENVLDAEAPRENDIVDEAVKETDAVIVELPDNDGEMLKMREIDDDIVTPRDDDGDAEKAPDAE